MSRRVPPGGLLDKCSFKQTVNMLGHLLQHHSALQLAAVHLHHQGTLPRQECSLRDPQCKGSRSAVSQVAATGRVLGNVASAVTPSVSTLVKQPFGETAIPHPPSLKMAAALAKRWRVGACGPQASCGRLGALSRHQRSLAAASEALADLRRRWGRGGQALPGALSCRLAGQRLRQGPLDSCSVRLPLRFWAQVAVRWPLSRSAPRANDILGNQRRALSGDCGPQKVVALLFRATPGNSATFGVYLALRNFVWCAPNELQSFLEVLASMRDTRALRHMGMLGRCALHGRRSEGSLLLGLHVHPCTTQ